MDTVWIQLVAIYGALFVRKFGQKDNGTWFDTLKDLTPKALESGIERLRRSCAGDKFAEFPPNSLEFRRLCTAYYDELTLPKVGAAYAEFLDQTHMPRPHFSHPVIGYVSRKMTENKGLPYNSPETYAQFKEKYEQVCWYVKQGHQLPNEPFTPLAQLQPSPKSAVAEAHLLQLRKALGMKPR